jgi:uncharacterized protein (DUF1501 family)
MTITRRHFIAGCSTAIAAMAGGRIADLAFAGELGATAASDEILITVFLRGGCDGLSLVAPYDDGNYVTRRGGLAIPGSAALDINPQNTTVTSSFGLHPQAGPLRELYAAQKLAIVHACGLNDDTRSHFDAMDYIERGTPGNKNTSTGWLTRHLRCVNPTGALPTLAAGSATPASLLSDLNAISMTDGGSFALSSHWRYSSKMLGSLKKFYGGSSAFQTIGARTIQTVETLAAEEMAYTPQPGVAYPDNSFGNALKLVAQMIKLDLGLRIATVDFGGWDTHESQGAGGDPNGYFARQIDTLARSLHAFYNDLPLQQNKLTVVVMSEFGRRLGVNASNGTDHGHGNVMLVLGGKVNGGKMYGAWPGLLDLDQSQDLKITTDYRRVLSEVLVRRLDNPKLGIVFPGYTGYAPLGITGSAADDLPIDYAAGFKGFLPLSAR